MENHSSASQIQSAIVSLTHTTATLVMWNKLIQSSEITWIQIIQHVVTSSEELFLPNDETKQTNRYKAEEIITGGGGGGGGGGRERWNNHRILHLPSLLFFFLLPLTSHTKKMKQMNEIIKRHERIKVGNKERHLGDARKWNAEWLRLSRRPTLVTLLAVCYMSPLSN